MEKKGRGKQSHGLPVLRCLEAHVLHQVRDPVTARALVDGAGIHIDADVGRDAGGVLRGDADAVGEGGDLK